MDLTQPPDRHLEGLELRDLNEADLAQVRRYMASAQYRFVVDPAGAVMIAEGVVTKVLRAKGYPLHSEPAGQHTNDLDELRRRFLAARKTVQEVAGTAFVLDDAASAAPRSEPADLRLEHDVTPASARREDP